jgi:hypothetical protein
MNLQPIATLKQPSQAFAFMTSIFSEQGDKGCRVD